MVEWAEGHIETKTLIEKEGQRLKASAAISRRMSPGITDEEKPLAE